MMPAAHRISRRSDFSRTLKRGVRVSTRDLVLTAFVVPTQWPDPSGRRTDAALVGGPWLGLIVSKAVGPAVTRHRVARHLRAAFTCTMGAVPAPETFVVVRALPTAADRSTADFADQLRDGLSRKRIRELSRFVALPDAADSDLAVGGLDVLDVDTRDIDTRDVDTADVDDRGIHSGGVR